MKNKNWFLAFSTVAILTACAPVPNVADVPAKAPAATIAQPQSAQGVGVLNYKDIEQGLTPDGFPYLGHANAPVTLIDYSDFL